MSEGFKPFPQIPHDVDYEGEINPNAVKAEDTLFFSPSEKIVLTNLSLLSEVEAGRVSVPGDDQAEAFDLASSIFTKDGFQDTSRLRKYMVAQYPFGLDKMQEVVGGFSSVDPNLRKNKADFEKILIREYAPPDNIQVKYRFHEHGVYPEDFDPIKESLKHHIKSAFVLGEKNVFVGEDGNGFTNRDKSFQEGYAKFGSYRRAQTYMKIYRQTGKRVDPGTMDATHHNYVTDQIHRTSLSDRYLWAELTAVDELVAEGYDIDYQREPGVRDFIVTPEKIKTLEEFKAYQRGLVGECQVRDEKVIKMIREIEKRAKQKTNIFVAMGVAHAYSVTSIYPYRLGLVTKFESTESELEKTPLDYIFQSLAYTGDASDELWQLAFEEYNAAYVPNR